MPKRLLELDVLRGLAALAVVACHFASSCVELGCASSDFHWGSYGPHLFFIISGFVIFLTLRRTRTAADFIVSRVSRLYPVYWVSVLVALVAFRYCPLPGESVTVGQALVNLTMLQTWLRVPDLDVVYWTLGVELKFYAVMFGLFLLGLLGAIDLIAGLWLAAILGWWTATTLLGLSLPEALATPLNVHYGPLFIAGILFYRLKTDGPTALRLILLGCCLAAQGVIEGAEAAIVVALLFGVFTLFVTDRLGWIVCRPLVAVGTISYSLYLLHHPIGNVVMVSLRSVSDSPVLLSLAALVASLAASVAVTRLIEQPSLRYCRDRYHRWRERRTSSAATLQLKGTTG